MKIKQLLRLTLAFMFVTTIFSPSLWAETIAEKTKDMMVQKGYFTTYWDDNKGQLYLEIAKPGEEFIFVTGLPGGLGSNDIGLDRGQLGQSLLVRFEKMGDKVFLHQINLKFRADSDNAKERKAVEDAFATSILGGFKVAATNNCCALRWPLCL